MPQGIKSEETFNYLSDVFETLRFRGNVFFSSDLSAPWGIDLEKRGFPRFHIALKGSCFVGLDKAEPLEANEMDIFLLPGGDAHWLADSPENERTLSHIAEDACELGKPLFQNGPTTHKLMCGLIMFDAGLSHPIIDALPPIIHLNNIGHDSTIWQIVILIDKEIAEHGYRKNAIVDKLTEALFLKIMSHFLSESEENFSFLKAVKDKRIHQALMLMHREPGKDWTLEEIGRQVGMSKATLVRHFQEALGMAPIAYLSQWRRLKAYNALKYTKDPIDKIALSLGFTSGRTLSRALVRELGMTPAEIRARNE
ncbi:Exoenzyme S synthesis regulatory protein ExsA [Grimontia celer]|uniref:Exoenzyme S synthesis regulatory protein ExsA n=1 Tax=Grimontia celer TaxID=1796497 RepID=A0A128EWF2_9GAMM|nr:AraC family transcriptional regulator [Grimontia celer]CZF78321.1 Exoenzyme S synthesis regulatory protein ExsA [Grimontia celer]